MTELLEELKAALVRYVRIFYICVILLTLFVIGCHWLGHPFEFGAFGPRGFYVNWL